MGSVGELLGGVCFFEPFGEFHGVKEAGQLRCCSKSWRFFCRDQTSKSKAVLCRYLAFRRVKGLREAVVGQQVCWGKIHTLDIANVLDACEEGLRHDECVAIATKTTTKLQPAEAALAHLEVVLPRLTSLARMSLSLSMAQGQIEKLTAPNVLQAVGMFKFLQEFYIEVDHSSLEVALLGALSSLKSLRRLWIKLRSKVYNEAICGALAARLPSERLEVLGLTGTARQVRDILDALGPHGEACLPRLRRLDLSVDPESPDGRVGEPSGAGGGDIPSGTVWRVLERGAPNLENICLWGALSWYPPVGDVWFAQLIILVENGFGSKLSCLDLRRNRIREDVVARVRERLRNVRLRSGHDFCLLWDGD